MSFHFLVRFDPPPQHAARFRAELLRVVAAAQGEAGCIRIQAFESVRDPAAFAIHSEWVDEAAFDVHSGLPHTVQFIRRAEELLGRPVVGFRCRQIAGGPGAGLGRSEQR